MLISNILMVKGVSKVSVENWSHHVGRNCGWHVSFCCFEGFKDFLHCDFKVNGGLVYLSFEFKSSIVYLKIMYVALEVF